MYKGKHVKKITHMSKRAALLVLSLVMILSVTAGGTLAYLVVNGGEKVNTFQPGEVTTKTEEDFKDGEIVKDDVEVKNTGNVAVRVRAQVVICWADEENNPLGVSVPESAYEIEYNDTQWTKGTDGYWYYKDVVPAGEKTEKLLKCTLKQNGPDGAHLQVTILTQAVQNEAWVDAGNQWPSASVNTAN